MTSRSPHPALHGATSLGPESTFDALTRLVADEAGVARACRVLRDDDARTLAEQREITSIPAPPFGEEERAARMVDLMRASGLDEVELDPVGNVLSRLPGSGPAGAPLVVSAHLDTVFAPETPIEIRAEGDRIFAPGISDDGRGLAALLALARALVAGRVRPAHPLLIVATVGEEGPGDLRGVRSLFAPGGAAAKGCLGFVSLDGAGSCRIVNAGLGVRRYRVVVTGPGGHSWVDRASPNPIHALARAVDGLLAIPLPVTPTTTLSVGRWAGGTAINAIPREAWMEFEIRSENAETLAEVDQRARRVVMEAVSAAGAAHDRRLRMNVEAIGDRPAASTPPDSVLVRAAGAATRAVGGVPELAVSSTDANIPMAAGVEAITMGAGGEAGMIHTPDEWYRNVRGPDGLIRALLTLLVADRLHAEGGR